MDCHCECGLVYGSASATRFHNNGGAFTWRIRVQGQELGLDMNATLEEKFSISVTGTSMSPESCVYNPARLKIVEEDAPCSHADNVDGVEGLVCERPPGNNLLAIAVCDTYPS